MPTYDIVSKVDIQTLDNAINAATKEITTRFDFRDSKTEIELDKKSLVVHILTENEMRVTAIEDVVRSRLIKQKIDRAWILENSNMLQAIWFVKT